MGAKDMTGLQFGRLTVLEREGSCHGRHATWKCLCSCGCEIVVRGYNLRTERTQSCGCYRSEITAERNRRPAPGFGKEIKA